MLSLLVFVCTLSIPLSTESRSIFTSVRYLEDYGFLKSNSFFPSTKSVRSAIVNFQRMYKIPTTGWVDGNVRKLMASRRCGSPDIREESKNSRFSIRSNRYVTSRHKWSQRTLTYGVTDYGKGKGISPNEIDQTITRAFKIWSDHSPFTFIRVQNSLPDIEIKFAEGEHGDSKAFDGRGKVLAHASLPQNGDIHFDDAEPWKLRGIGSDSVDLLFVAAHEIGHSLGLAHSEDTSALMFAYYRGFSPNLSLSRDDIAGIQAMYGTSNGDGSETPGGDGGGQSSLCPPQLRILALLLRTLAPSFPVCTSILFSSCC